LLLALESPPPNLDVEASLLKFFPKRDFAKYWQYFRDSEPASLVFMFKPEVAVAMRSAPSLAHVKDRL
jgi:hypothetical protein